MLKMKAEKLSRQPGLEVIEVDGCRVGISFKFWEQPQRMNDHQCAQLMSRKPKKELIDFAKRKWVGRMEIKS